MTKVYLEFRPSRVNGGWLRLFTVPFAQVDGSEYQCPWNQPLTLELEPGPHVFRCFVRYKKLIPGEGGAAERRIDIPDTDSVFIEVRNAFTNGSPFVPKVRRP